ncbi:hypothetical protein AM1_C0348 (plasmid) [Acaryochloris marina MBIC11017]|uniref:Uncharacterized protein n=1 Tax=Acaryochloris marina (strain MBIC 11017) TaxID=329726 RepID=A8ZN76_ACAM1|nr:hypothetical protein AM1_C0348 [Acaryochloris marina MBIC11017]
MHKVDVKESCNHDYKGSNNYQEDSNCIIAEFLHVRASSITGYWQPDDWHCLIIESLLVSEYQPIQLHQDC